MKDNLQTKMTGLKHFRLFIFIGIFLLFAIIGFFVIRQVAPLFLPKSSNGTSQPSNVLSINQGTLLLIHANQLNSAHPQLISVWAIFISKSSPPSVIAKSLYPDIGSPERSQQIAQAFNYSEKAGLSAQFIQQVQADDLFWNGFIILDDEALNQLTHWINGNGTSFNSPSDITNAQVILEAEQTIFQETCKNLVRPDSARGDRPRWVDLIPAHFETDLFFRDTAVNWDRITLSTPAPDCKVLVTP